MVAKSAQSPGQRIRKNVEELTSGELAQLRESFRVAQQDGRYAKTAGIAGLPLPSHVQHGSPLFLPWNRSYTWQFELMLGKEDASNNDASNISVPVWDWTSASTRQVPAAFAEEKLDDGQVNPLYAAVLDQQALGVDEMPLGATTTLRQPAEAAAELPTADDVARALAFDDYIAFSAALEQLSNAVHVWVGGHMALLPFAAYDPLFWAHSAMVDEIWWLWQEAHPDMERQVGIESEVLDPFGVSVGEVLNTNALGYTYAPVRGYANADQLLTGAGNDLPSLRDGLGFRHYATAFAEVFASPSTEPPLTVGIFGSWGMGKSTLLESIVRELERGQGETPPKTQAQGKTRTPFVHVVRFNAWDYSAEEAIWPGLVRTTMEKVERDVPWRWWRRFSALFARNFRREWKQNSSRIVVGGFLLGAAAVLAVVSANFSPAAIGAGVVAIGVAGFLKVANDTVTSPTSKWIASLFQESDYGRRIGYMGQIREDLAFLEKRLREEADTPRRVLIIIDDLDRCEPDKAVEVLQAINRMLDFSSFIVCVGFDARLVTAAIQSHYQGLLGEAGASGYEYLDKIVQIPFRIPEPDAETIAYFLQTQLPTAAASISDATETKKESTPSEPDQNSSASSTGPGTDRYVVQKQGLDVPEAPLGQRVAFRPEELRAFEEVSEFLRPNPRHIKRLINVYRLVRTFAESELRASARSEKARLVLDNPRATIRWLLLSAQWPYTARALLSEGRSTERRGNLDPAKKPLKTLLKNASGAELRAGQARWDDDIQQLEALVDDTNMTWQQLRVIRDYTVNFNPAVEEELERLRRARQPPSEDAPVRPPSPPAQRRRPSASSQQARRTSPSAKE